MSTLGGRTVRSWIRFPVDPERADVRRLAQFLEETELETVDAAEQARAILRRFGELLEILGEIEGPRS